MQKANALKPRLSGFDRTRTVPNGPNFTGFFGNMRKKCSETLLRSNRIALNLSAKTIDELEILSDLEMSNIQDILKSHELKLNENNIK